MGDWTTVCDNCDMTGDECKCGSGDCECSGCRCYRCKKSINKCKCSPLVCRNCGKQKCICATVCWACHALHNECVCPVGRNHPPDDIYKVGETIETYAAKGDLDKVKKILTQPVRIEILENALYQAAKNNHKNVVNFIRLTYLNNHKGFEVIIRGACEGGHLDIISNVLMSCSESDRLNLVNFTVSHAAQNNRADIIKYLMSGIQTPKQWVDMCIESATKYGHFDIFKLFESQIDTKTQHDLIFTTENTELRDYLITKFKDNPLPLFSEHYKCLICKYRKGWSDYDSNGNKLYILTKCNHSFHTTCIINSIKNTKGFPICPSCGTLLSETIQERMDNIN